jgi:hypothetical protein
MQVSKNFPEVREPSPKYSLNNVDIEQVPYRRPANIRRHPNKHICPGDLLSEICVPLAKR